MKEYKITEEQLELIGHYKQMFEFNANLIQDLCRGEKDDIVYGFALGEIHSHLKQCFVDMMELEQEIMTFNTKEK